jgi:hypothetical protein
MITGAQDEEELRVFRDFVHRENLPIVARSIEKRSPPEPDILCSFTNGYQVAFELVEICHEENAAFFGSVRAISNLLEEAYTNLPAELRRRIDARFAGRPLSFSFASAATINRIRSALPQIFADLAGQPEGNDQFLGLSTATKKVINTIRIVGRVYEGSRPAFNVAFSFRPNDVVVETVRAKLCKTYRTPHPIELLAHFGGHAWEKSNTWASPLSEALAMQGTGPFRRVWVLGYERVRFVYPAPGPEYK